MNVFGIYAILFSINVLIAVVSIIIFLSNFFKKSYFKIKALIYTIFCGLLMSCILLFYHFYNYLEGIKNIYVSSDKSFNINILKDALDFNYSYFKMEMIFILLFMFALFLFICRYISIQQNHKI